MLTWSLQLLPMLVVSYNLCRTTSSCKYSHVISTCWFRSMQLKSTVIGYLHIYVNLAHGLLLPLHWKTLLQSILVGGYDIHFPHGLSTNSLLSILDFCWHPLLIVVIFNHAQPLNGLSLFTWLCLPQHSLLDLSTNLGISSHRYTGFPTPM